MHIHFISIGGAVMHNLAIALHKKGYLVTGSDDEIFNPAKENLQRFNLLPEKQGWFPTKITTNIDAVILGMHAKNDNPELIKAKTLNLNVYSFPEYLYEQTKNKTRVVIGGSHGKTTITSMVMHVLKDNNIKFDYMVGAHIEGFETMVGLSEDTNIAIFEGDEYLSSALDRRPKFHLYKPHIALLSGIAWDHINVFPTFENYLDQFRIFVSKIENGGFLTYFNEDKNIQNVVKESKNNIETIPYNTHKSITKKGKTYLIFNEKKFPLHIFGKHNLQNIQGAKFVCNKLGITDENFYKSISGFTGASKRLQLIAQNRNCNVFLDFAHSPSKLKATINAVKEQYPNTKLIACFELHTYSSLNKTFLLQYNKTMNNADVAIVYYNKHTFTIKKLQEFSPDEVKNAFNLKNIIIINSPEQLKLRLNKYEWKNTNFLFMSSGNFSNINIKNFAKEKFSQI